MLAVLAVTMAAAPSSAATYNLRVDETTHLGETVWGYALVSYDVGGGVVPGDNIVTVPGPRITVLPGDTTLTINLTNDLTVPTSIVIASQNQVPSPVFVMDSEGRQRVKSFAAETAGNGGTGVYTWTGLKPGTHMYESGTNPGKQVAMGLYGAMTHDEAVGQAYPGIDYDAEVVIFYSDLDPQMITYDVSRPMQYDPRYFLLNGVADGSLTLPAGAINDRVLLRFLNAGLRYHGPELLGPHMQLVAEDGNPYPYIREQYTAMLPAGKTKDAIWIPTGSGDFPVLDQFHSLTDGDLLGGGMVAKLSVVNPADAPTASDDSYITDEDTPLNVAAAGVLTNDTVPGGADPISSTEVVSGTSHGSLTLYDDGSFDYVPDPNYNGSDAFTYQASNGILSNVATVTITVNPVADSPSATIDSASTPAGMPVVIDVLANDINPDGSTPVITTAPLNGGVAVNPDKTVTYTPDPDYTGLDSFIYEIYDQDGLNPASAQVDVEVTDVPNQAPTAADDSAQVQRSNPPTPVIIPVLDNDVDPEGALDPASVRLAGGALTVQTQQRGTATVNVGTGTITYTPRNGFTGSDSFVYTVKDSAVPALESNQATVRVNVVR